MGGVFTTGEDTLSLRLKSKLFDLRVGYANPQHTKCAVFEDRPRGNKKGHPQGVSFFIGAEGGIRTLVWCYPQTDFESAPL